MARAADGLGRSLPWSSRERRRVACLGGRRRGSLRVGAPEKADASRAWEGVDEQLQPLSSERGFTVGDPGEVAARVGRAFDDT